MPPSYTRGGNLCDLSPKTYESNFVHHKFFRSENNNHVMKTFYRPLFCIPANNLHIFADIQPVELRRQGATLSLARRNMKPGQLLHSALTCPPSGNARHLKSRHPSVPAAPLITFSDNKNNRAAALWEDHQRNAEWLDDTTRLRMFIPDIGTHPPGMAL